MEKQLSGVNKCRCSRRMLSRGVLMRMELIFSLFNKLEINVFMNALINYWIITNSTQIT